MSKLDDGSDFPWDRSAWFDVKFKLGMQIPNLPYVIDNTNDVKISETFAVMKYIGRKNQKLLPTSNKSFALAENLEGKLADFRMGFIKICYMGADRHAWMNKNAIPFLEVFEGLLENKESGWFLPGEKSPTYIDCYAWEIIDHHCLLKPLFLDSFPKLKAWKLRFSELKEIRSYHESDKFEQYPINNKMATWGGQHENDGIMLVVGGKRGTFEAKI